jgi:hypothetical protein
MFAAGYATAAIVGADVAALDAAVLGHGFEGGLFSGEEGLGAGKKGNASIHERIGVCGGANRRGRRSRIRAQIAGVGEARAESSWSATCVREVANLGRRLLSRATGRRRGRGRGGGGLGRRWRRHLVA